jgi:hypothetical protein
MFYLKYQTCFTTYWWKFTEETIYYRKGIIVMSINDSNEMIDLVVIQTTIH